MQTPPEALLDNLERLLRDRRNLPLDARSRAIFARAYFESLVAEDVSALTPTQLVNMAVRHLRLAMCRQPGEVLVRISNPHHRGATARRVTVVEIVNDDMPFLFDSCLMALARLGSPARFTLHPIIPLQRDETGVLETVGGPHARAESLIRVEIARETDSARCQYIEETLRRVFTDVRLAVDDWPVMRERALAMARELGGRRGNRREELREHAEFLRWLADDHFTFLGMVDYVRVNQDGHDVLRPEPDSRLGVLRRMLDGASPHELALLPSELDAGDEGPGSGLILTKTTTMATVHRATPMDYIGVRHYDRRGRVQRETCVVGLYTSAAVMRRPFEVPLLRRKLDVIMARSGLSSDSHAGKSLQHILETLPRDELVQASEDELFHTANAIYLLQERPRTRLFLRRDPYRRFWSCLVYLPRERFERPVRLRLERILRQRLGGESLDSDVNLAEPLLARIHVIVRGGQVDRVEPDVGRIEAELARAVRSWEDDLRDALVESHGERQGLRLWRQCQGAFPVAYTDAFSARTAVDDIAASRRLNGQGGLELKLERDSDGQQRRLRFRMLCRGEVAVLSAVLPVLENLGTRVLTERPYELDFGRLAGHRVSVHDFVLEMPTGPTPEVGAIAADFCRVFARVWSGEAENDGLNRLVLTAGLAWREVELVRAWTRYLQQLGGSFSQSYREEALLACPEVTRLLVQHFEQAFAPDSGQVSPGQAEAAAARVGEMLEAVESLDHDRILREYHSLVRATLRTSFYLPGHDQANPPVIAFKLDPSRIENMPLPRPRYEIFVYSPRFEGVHLRGGKVARGGIRWSDRREDFRTEVLGLVKAQMVKNAIIVPVGAKGGFVVKQPPVTGDREQMQAEGVRCYRLFIEALLTLTDNYVEGRCVTPEALVRYDDDDPYLVVAADKGTASFSDIANAIARARGFWLDDAFASGGSSGYDHKAMGITARGAWECVKRHFRELGRDIQREPFTVAGIGDMSGDVFGNGMLLSPHIRLVAAFNHRHVFIDPAPDCERAFAERKRLFETPGSSWSDYDTALISDGGGVFRRDAKRIEVTSQMARTLAIEPGPAEPQALIRAILAAPVDLLWNGGIGTYVKDAEETHAEVGDRVNDGVRVDAQVLRCKVVGEGGNLGLTQQARISYAAAGGYINTDAIDNSAGVGCSDREVNIKILFKAVMEADALDYARRDRLLGTMTEEVAALVLEDNYQQSLALSLMQRGVQARLPVHAWLMRRLETVSDFSREVEGLPDEQQIAALQTRNASLTRPELAVLLAWAKIDAYDTLLDSDLADDRVAWQPLCDYFPRALGAQFSTFMTGHRLRREIIVNVVINSMLNRMGAGFARRLSEELAVPMATVARAWLAAREALGLRELWRQIEALDHHVPAATWLTLFEPGRQLLEQVTRRFAAIPEATQDIAASVAHYGPQIAMLVDRYGERVDVDRLASLSGAGVPEALARQVLALEWLTPAVEVVRLADARDLSPVQVAMVREVLVTELGLDQLLLEADRIEVDGHWAARARGGLRDDLYAGCASLIACVLDDMGADSDSPAAQVLRWRERHADVLAPFAALLSELQVSGALDMEGLTVAVRELQRLCQRLQAM